MSDSSDKLPLSSKDFRPSLLGRASAFAQSPLVVASLVGLVFAGFTFWHVARNNNDVTRNIVAGRTFCNPAQMPAPVFIHDGAGYDGQFVYRFALDPFTRKIEDYGISLDGCPGYRQQRILLPLLAHLIARGKPQRVALALILVNWAALCLIGFVAARYARALGASAWWGLPIALYPGFLLTLSRDLTEIVGVCFLLCGLLLLRLRQPVLATISLCLAILGRDTCILGVGVVAAVWVWEQMTRRGWVPMRLEAWLRGESDPTPPLPIYVVAVPMAMYASWLLYLRSVWGLLPFQEYARSPNPMGVLFHPFQQHVRMLLGRFSQSISSPLDNANLTECLLLIVTTIAACLLWRRTRANLMERFIFVVYLALASFYGPTIWEEDYGFLRILSELYVFAILVLIGGRWDKKLIIGAGALFVFWNTLQSFTFR